MITFIAFVVILGIIIFVHELGHFMAAKAFGVGVETFAFGFPPRLWSKRYKGTEYKINLIPFGGYVKLLGEGEERSEVDMIHVNDEHPSKGTKTTGKKLYEIASWKQIIIFSAGVAMNLLIAFIAVWLLYLVGFKPIELGPLSQKVYPGIDGTEGTNSTLQVKIDDIEKNTPAEKEGLRAGDIILTVDGKKVYFSGDVVTEVQSKVDDSGAKVTLGIKRGNEELNKVLSTYKSKVTDSQGREHEINRIGIILQTEGEIQAGPIVALKNAVISTFNVIKYTLIGIGDLFYKIFAELRLSPNIAGPIAVVAGTSYYAHLGLEATIQFAVILSIGVALFNILPIPALDGGFVLFTLLEMGAKKRIPLRVKNALILGGFGALIILIVIVSARDFITFGVNNYLLKLIGK